jgi:hypothetical protein
MPVPYSFSAATSAIPLSQLDSNFNTPITLGNTAIQLGNTVTTLNNMTLANVTVSSGNVTITNVSVTTANATTVNTTTLIATTANVTTGNVTNLISGNVSLTGGTITGTPISGSTGSFTTLTTSSTVTLNGGTANGVTYLNGSKVLTSGSALTFDGSRLFLGTTAVTTSSSQSGEVYSTGAAGFLFTNTTAANYPLSVKNEGTSGTRNLINFYEGTAGGTARANISFDGSNNFTVASASSLIFSPSSTEQMRLTSTGLGIGTSSPGVKLDVVGELRTQNTSPAGITVKRTDGVNANGWLNFVGSDDVVDGSVRMATDVANALTFLTASTERLRIDSSGNLGLGVTPSAWGSGDTILQVKAGSGTTALWGRNNTGRLISNAYYDGTNYRYVATASATSYETNTSGGFAWQIAPSGTAGNTITFTQAMTLDASGNLGIGTSSPLTKTHVRVSALSGYTSVANLGLLIERGDGPAALNIASPNTESGFIWFADQDSASVGNIAYNHPSNFMSFQTNGSERARITSGGDLLVAKTTSDDSSQNGLRLQSNGSITSTMQVSDNTDYSFVYYSKGASAYRFYVGGGGTVYATNTTISAISDQRLKENIQDLDVGLDKIMALKPRKFDWKSGKGKDIKGDRGWIAQEFEQVFPDMIDEWKDPAPEGEEPYKSVRADLIPVLVKAIQELKAEFDAYKATHP